MNISLPDQLKDFVDEQVGSGRYGSPSEYVIDLIRLDLIGDAERRKTHDGLEALLMEGLHSGRPTEMTIQDWEDVRSEAVKQFASRNTA